MLDFKKCDGLVPVVIQNVDTLEVLMLGYMNEEAYKATLETQKVTFYSRSKQRLWTKGEESGNFLLVKEMFEDCDNDTLLIKVSPVGNTCHTGARSCFKTELEQNFIFELENVINQRYEQAQDTSYVNSLRQKGINKIAQKVGEEAVETVIAAINQTEKDFINESSDLVFHLLVLLREKNIRLADIANNLKARHKG